MPLSSHIPCTAACISSIVTTAIGTYIHTRSASSKYDDVRAKKRAQISHAQSTKSEAQKTYWTGDVGHPKTGGTGGGGAGAERCRRPMDPRRSLEEDTTQTNQAKNAQLDYLGTQG